MTKTIHRPRGRCPEMVKFLQDYVEGTLDSDVAARFERHLSTCPGCVAFLNTYRETVRIGRSLREEEVPPDLKERILATIPRREGKGLGK